MAASTCSLLPGDYVVRRREGAPQWLYAALAAVTALSVFTDPVHAQRRGGHVSARFGIATPSDDYQSNCGHSSLALGVDVHGRGRWFPQLSLDHFSGSGGGDVACLPITPSGGIATGGLRIENASRLTLGGGGRVGGGTLQVEGAVLGGFVAGQRGFQAEVRNDERQILPTVGGQVGVVLFRYAVLSAAVHWTRLSRGERLVTGRIVTTSTDWSPMATMQFGVRVPWGQQ